MLRAIKIDVQEKTIEEIEITGWEAAAPTIGCELMAIASYLGEESDSVVFVDETGLLTETEDTRFFSIKGVTHQAFAGNSVVMGENPEDGEAVDLKLSVKEVQDLITFHRYYPRIIK